MKNKSVGVALDICGGPIDSQWDPWGVSGLASTGMQKAPATVNG